MSQENEKAFAENDSPAKIHEQMNSDSVQQPEGSEETKENIPVFTFKGVITMDADENGEGGKEIKEISLIVPSEGYMKARQMFLKHSKLQMNFGIYIKSVSIDDGPEFSPSTDEGAKTLKEFDLNSIRKSKLRLIKILEESIEELKNTDNDLAALGSLEQRMNEEFKN